MAEENGTDLHPLPDRMHIDGDRKPGRNGRCNGEYL